jgi:hypothetical protein
MVELVAVWFSHLFALLEDFSKEYSGVGRLARFWPFHNPYRAGCEITISVPNLNHLNPSIALAEDNDLAKHDVPTSTSAN